MKSNCLVQRVWLALLAIAAIVAFAPGIRAATTLENMQAAFNGESNAHARYIAFAQQADKEGYRDVANLFRAAARAEQIHASNHAEVIKQLGAQPKADIENAQVKSTRENLESAVKGETYERDTMYPDFIKQAKSDGNAKATRSLNLAKTAEAEHAKLYRAALEGLSGGKTASAAGYYVCPVCGFTARVPDFEKCPSCFTPKEKFEKIA
ncbi:rubrerythrin family protein [Occallatibacter riparius]|uniref:Rubrerythrin family protein n=1 Tax=Occallatibacter riparius TaxID=1002689 RepID=A0A9J7BPR4_9BACT|nr:rubrerythrin family protein [Occallatibacter riparius]UWZ84591.1 rubrerythrin family protein [Occallatibacter riparius]